MNCRIKRISIGKIALTVILFHCSYFVSALGGVKYLFVCPLVCYLQLQLHGLVPAPSCHRIYDRESVQNQESLHRRPLICV